MNNPNSPWRKRNFDQTLSSNSAEELEKRLQEKLAAGYTLIRKHDYYSGKDRRFIAVVRKVS